jgi:hypothetical protein
LGLPAIGDQKHEYVFFSGQIAFQGPVYIVGVIGGHRFGLIVEDNVIPLKAAGPFLK